MPLLHGLSIPTAKASVWALHLEYISGLIESGTGRASEIQVILVLTVVVGGLVKATDLGSRGTWLPWAQCRPTEAPWRLAVQGREFSASSVDSSVTVSSLDKLLSFIFQFH